jgi:pilus assembly protein CpaD
MTTMLRGARVLTRARRPALTLLSVLMIAASAGGCSQGPRFNSPFTLANPNERWPIKVSQGEVTLDLAVYRGTDGLNASQMEQVYDYLRDYKLQGAEKLLIRAPTGGPNEGAARRAYEDVRRAFYRAGLNPREVRLEPYYAAGDPEAPLRLSYLEFVAKGPDCPDWSENLARDPNNMPWPNMGCAGQRNLAAMVANPEDLLHPRGERPRPSERRQTVWGKYINGDMTGSKWSPNDRPLPERALTSEIAPAGGN